ncbi:MAG: peptidoglycan-associated lipoprotein Pal [Elusimicrobiales bacterium]|nr:peptidoglycan-associated lipoprotein Pal [Elusimicrobiales bacterium]
MRKNTLFLVLALPLIAGFLLSSCNNKNRKNSGQTTDMTGDTVTMPGMDILDSTDTLTTEGEIRGGEFLAQTNVRTIVFDYDRYELSEDSRAVLQANAALIKARKDWTVLVEGHCDDRGTVEYNLALGQKRAKAVRDYYVRLGVPESAIGTISYGEEKPLCSEATDACWLSNRRAETKIKVK